MSYNVGIEYHYLTTCLSDRPPSIIYTLLIVVLIAYALFMMAILSFFPTLNCMCTNFTMPVKLFFFFCLLGRLLFSYFLLIFLDCLIMSIDWDLLPMTKYKNNGKLRKNYVKSIAERRGGGGPRFFVLSYKCFCIFYKYPLQIMTKEQHCIVWHGVYPLLTQKNKSTNHKLHISNNSSYLKTYCQVLNKLY